MPNTLDFIERRTSVGKSLIEDEGPAMPRLSPSHTSSRPKRSSDSEIDDLILGTLEGLRAQRHPHRQGRATTTPATPAPLTTPKRLYSCDWDTRPAFEQRE